MFPRLKWPETVRLQPDRARRALRLDHLVACIVNVREVDDPGHDRDRHERLPPRGRLSMFRSSPSSSRGASMKCSPRRGLRIGEESEQPADAGSGTAAPIWGVFGRRA